MTNLTIGYPQVQSAAVRINAAANFSTSANENEFYPMLNAGRGWRSQFYKASAAASSVYLNWDLGSAALAATPITASKINAVILSRFDLIKNLASTISLKVQGSNDDFSSSTDIVSIADIDAETLKGLWANDWINTFALSSAFRYFRLNLTKTAGANITPILNKVYFCQLLDLGVEPNEYQVQRLIQRQPFKAQSGALHPLQSSTPRYQVDLTWEQVSDSNAALFMREIAGRRLDTSFFLSTSTYHDVLDNQQLLHVECVEASTWNPSGKVDKNNISASFIEVLG